MIRFAALLACCLCCSVSVGYPVPKLKPKPPETLPEPREIDPLAIQIGMTQEAIEKILPRQNLKIYRFVNVPGCRIHYQESEIVVWYLDSGVANEIYREPK